MIIDFDGDVVTGKAAPVRFTQGGGGQDCTANGGTGGDAISSPVPSTVTITKRTDDIIEGTLEVPTDKGAQRLTFRAPVVPPAPPSQVWACCLKE